MKRLIFLSGALLLTVVGAGAWYVQRTAPETPAQRVYDEAGVIPPGDVPRFEEYLRWIFDESDVDIRLVLVKNLGGTRSKMRR